MEISRGGEKMRKSFTIVECIIVLAILCLLWSAVINISKLQTPISEINNCVGVYYEELNGGTYTNILQNTDNGIVDCFKYRGKYICNPDGSISFEEVGTIPNQEGER